MSSRTRRSPLWKLPTSCGALWSNFDRPRLIILDPLAAFLAGVRSNDQGDIRAALSPLVQLAEEFDVAIVFVHHDRKGTGSHAS